MAPPEPKKTARKSTSGKPSFGPPLVTTLKPIMGGQGRIIINPTADQQFLVLSFLKEISAGTFDSIKGLSFVQYHPNLLKSEISFQEKQKMVELAKQIGNETDLDETPVVSGPSTTDPLGVEGNGNKNEWSGFKDCVICKETVKLKSKGNDPLILPCLHTVCSNKCLDMHLQQNLGSDEVLTLDSVASCPKCYLKFSKLKVEPNLALKAVLEKEGVAGCGICTRKENAVVFCVGCEKMHCVYCFEQHKFSIDETFKGHRFVSVKNGLLLQKPVHTVECTLHLKPLTEYCRSDKALICKDCSKAHNHNGHEVINITEECESVREKFKEVSDETGEFQAEVEEMEKALLESLKANFDVHKLNMVRDAKSRIQMICAILMTQEKEFRTQVTAGTKYNGKVLNLRRSAMKGLAEQSKQCSRIARELLKFDDEFLLVANKGLIEAQFEHLKKVSCVPKVVKKDLANGGHELSLAPVGNCMKKIEFYIKKLYTIVQGSKQFDVPRQVLKRKSLVAAEKDSELKSGETNETPGRSLVNVTTESLTEDPVSNGVSKSGLKKSKRGKQEEEEPMDTNSTVDCTTTTNIVNLQVSEQQESKEEEISNLSAPNVDKENLDTDKGISNLSSSTDQLNEITDVSTNLDSTLDVVSDANITSSFAESPNVVAQSTPISMQQNGTSSGQKYSGKRRGRKPKTPVPEGGTSLPPPPPPKPRAPPPTPTKRSARIASKTITPTTTQEAPEPLAKRERKQRLSSGRLVSNPDNLATQTAPSSVFDSFFMSLNSTKNSATKTPKKMDTTKNSTSAEFSTPRKRKLATLERNDVEPTPEAGRNIDMNMPPPVLTPETSSPTTPRFDESPERFMNSSFGSGSSSRGRGGGRGRGSRRKAYQRKQPTQGALVGKPNSRPGNIPLGYYPFTPFLDDQMKISDNSSPNEDYCAICRDGGSEAMICCDICPKVFHTTCHLPVVNGIPQDDWQCHICKSKEQLINEWNAFQDFVNALCNEVPFVPSGNSKVDVYNIPKCNLTKQDFILACKLLCVIYKYIGSHVLSTVFELYFPKKGMKGDPIHLNHIRVLLTGGGTGQGKIENVEHLVELLRFMFEQAKELYKDSPHLHSIVLDIEKMFNEILPEYFPQFDPKKKEKEIPEVVVNTIIATKTVADIVRD